MTETSPRHGRHRKPADAGTGVEDVLGAVPATDGLPRHSRELKGSPGRSPWHRPKDRVVVVLLVVVTLTAGLLVWGFSDSRATTSETSAPAPPLPPPPGSVPGTLTEMWQGPSAATPAPVAIGSTVVTADRGEVLGRDALTGAVRWRYARDLPLCTVSAVATRVLTLYRKPGEAVDRPGCSEVTQLDPATGHRTGQRNGDAEAGSRLVTDGANVTTTGTKLLNTWRDDLVKSVEYGQVPAPVNPGKQPRTGCTYGSVAVATAKTGVIERCPNDPADRFTVYRAGDDFDEPKVNFSAVLAGKNAKLVAMSGDHAAIVLPERKLLVIYGADGNQRSAYPLDVPDRELAADPEGGVMITSSTPDNIYWFTGSKTLALSRKDLTPQWTLQGTLGPAVGFAGQLVVPIPGGIAVLNEENGSTLRTVGVDRHGYQGTVRLTGFGPVLLEQRGVTLTALR